MVARFGFPVVGEWKGLIFEISHCHFTRILDLCQSVWRINGDVASMYCPFKISEVLRKNSVSNNGRDSEINPAGYGSCMNCDFCD